jgi:hypothetical protein
VRQLPAHQTKLVMVSLNRCATMRWLAFARSSASLSVSVDSWQQPDCCSEYLEVVMRIFLMNASCRVAG